MVSTYGVLNTTSNETAFPELNKVYKESFEIKIRELFVLEYLNLWIAQYLLGFSIDQTYHIMEWLNEWFSDVNFRKVDTPFLKDSTNEN